MKKIVLMLILGGTLVLPVLTLAACPTDRICIENPLRAESFEELVGKIINFIFMVAVVLAPLMVIVGAIYFLTSGGDPAKLKTGKTIIVYTLVGFLIILLAKGIVAVVRGALGG